MFKIEKKQVTRFTLELECCECNIQDSLLIGDDYLNRDQALSHIPVDELGGWDISVKAKPVCPHCRTKSGTDSL